jgi:hypothetical protein
VIWCESGTAARKIEYRLKRLRRPEKIKVLDIHVGAPHRTPFLLVTRDPGEYSCLTSLTAHLLGARLACSQVAIGLLGFRSRNAWRERFGLMIKELPDFDLVRKQWQRCFTSFSGKEMMASHKAR